jgi:hypothetical protein
MKAVAAFLAILFLPGAYSQRASNDECINATVIPPNRGTTSNYTTAPIDIRQATINPLDPITNCSYFSYDDPRGTDGSSLWFTWQPQQTGKYEFATLGSYTAINSNDGDGSFEESIAAVIGIYQGDTCSGIEEIGCATPNTKLRSIDLTGAVKYYIKVGVFRAFRGGTVRLTVRPAPPAPSNTKCSSAITVNPTSTALITGDITNALVDDASFPCSDIFFGPQKGLWYKFTNTLNSLLSLTISTCYDQTEFDTIISVFEGTTCDALSCIGNVDDVGVADCGTRAVYGFLASPLKTYYVLIQGFEGSEGNFQLGFNASSNYFTLIDSETNRVIEPIGDSFSYSNVNSRLNIEAVFADESAIGSVRVTFDDPPRSFCEEFPPFSVFWDTDGNFFDAKPAIPPGTHTVTATPYAQDGCAGTAGTTISKTFEVFGCYVEYSVYDVVNNCPVASIYDFDFDFFVTEIDPMPCDVNIQVFAFCGFETNTVQIELRDTDSDAIVASKTEVTNPYFLFGNMGEILNSGSIGPGSYSIAATIDGIKHDAVRFDVPNACVQS